MHDVTWRALTTDDGPALARANAAVEAVDSTGEHFSVCVIVHESNPSKQALVRAAG